MKTIGFWCNKCKVKYSERVCGHGLPCGHDIKKALRVTTTRNKKKESVVFERGKFAYKVWICYGKRTTQVYKGTVRDEDRTKPEGGT